MTTTLDDTHDVKLVSWIESANDPATDFPIQNLPFGRFRRNDNGADDGWHIAASRSATRCSTCAARGSPHRHRRQNRADAPRQGPPCNES